jgi:6-phosphogluconate dehydrogenase
MVKNKIWLIWLAVMGENLARNIANNWYKISVYNRTSEKTKNLIEKKYSQNLYWTYSLKEFVESLETPRKIIIMVQAWPAIDQVINDLKEFIEPNDIIVDCWNSFYKDTKRRYESLKIENISFIWCWVSGWEEWALNWPSIMPGWDLKSYENVKNILESIAAKDFKWWKCVSYIWESGSWHFVKMVHNWIEYAIMQMMAEWYDILRKVYNIKAPQIAEIFELFNDGKLNSYLFEISGKVLRKKDEFRENEYLIDNILDKAWAKWTGLWTSIEWLENGSPVWTIIEATQARTISAKINLREKLSKEYNISKIDIDIELNYFIKVLWDTLYNWMLISYAQWLSLIKETSIKENWNINMEEITRIWQWWCIIRAKILEFLTDTYKKNNEVFNILELEEIRNELVNNLDSYKITINIWINNNIPTPSLSSALNYFYAITSDETAANFIQWLRDYFGAHTYERIDREWIFHTNWE